MIGAMNFRFSTRADAEDLAQLHREAWRYAYRGIIPGISLERMIARHGPASWNRMHDTGMRALVLEFDETVAGYATFGRCRIRGVSALGEIYEFYLKPEFHGIGFGKRLFAEAQRHLHERGLRRFLVWALADNDLGCRFYAGLGGQVRMRAYERFGGVRLERSRLSGVVSTFEPEGRLWSGERTSKPHPANVRVVPEGDIQNFMLNVRDCATAR
jgi:ribosomal protein S18 acetylase RimI-like enzyme